MMTKQVKTIGLLTVVIIIWGYLIYSVLASLSPKEDTEAFESKAIIYNRNTENINHKKFDLYIPNRDPFLDINLIKQKPKKKRSQVRSKSDSDDLNLIWSNINYKGVIAKKSSNQYLYLITIKNKEIILKLNQTYQNYKLVRANENKITLKYKTLTKSFSVSKNY